jgi:L,D-transpeptidase YcbB
MRAFFVALSIAGSALAQGAPEQAPPQQGSLAQPVRPSQSIGTKPTSLPGKPPVPASTPESRSAAELALSNDPVFDDGTYLRIKQTLLSYSDIEVRAAAGLHCPPTPSSRLARAVARSCCCGDISR